MTRSILILLALAVACAQDAGSGTGSGSAGIADNSGADAGSSSGSDGIPTGSSDGGSSGSYDGGVSNSGSFDGSTSGSWDNSNSGSGSWDNSNSGSGSWDNSNSGSASGSWDNSNSGSASWDNSNSNSGSGSWDNSNSGSGSWDNSNSGSASGSWDNSNSGSWDNSNSGSGSWDNSNSGSWDNSNSNSGSWDNSNSGSGSWDNSNSGSASGSWDNSNSNSGSGSWDNSNSGSGSYEDTGSIDEDDLAAAAGDVEWAKGTKRCREQAAAGQKSGRCCRRYGFGCKTAPRFECPAALATGAGATTGQEAARARYCCREHNVCRVRCGRDVAGAGNTTGAEAAGCCGERGVCGAEAVAAGRDADAARDAAERGAGKAKRGVGAEFAGNAGILEENPMFWVARVRRGMLQKSGALRAAPGRVYVTRIGAVVGGVRGEGVAITRGMNEALAEEEAGLVAAGAFGEGAGERALAWLVARAGRVLQTGAVDEMMYFTAEVMGNDTGSVDALFSDLSASAAAAEGDYGLSFTVFAAAGEGPSGPSVHDDGGLGAAEIGVMVAVGLLFAGLVAMMVKVRSNRKRAFEHPTPSDAASAELTYSSELSPAM